MTRSSTAEPSTETPRATARDVVAIWFRQRRLVAFAFGTLAALAVVAAWLQPVRYEATLKLLLRRDRVDAAVTPTRSDQPNTPPGISEEDLQSEAYLLESRDLHEQVVRTCGLEDSGLARRAWVPAWWPGSSGTDRRVMFERTVVELERRLQVEVLKRSYVLLVTYRDSEAERARCVLDSLASAYIDKNLTLKRPALALDFFQRQTSGYRDALDAAQADLVQFSQGAGLAAVELQKELTVRRWNEAEALLRQTDAAIAEVEQRLASLEAARVAMPSRQVTQARTADPAQLLDSLKSTLLEQQLKRTELLEKYSADYRLVKEIDAAIATTRAAIESAERTPLRDETTDNDPAYQWVREEITRLTPELTALKARRTAVARTVRQYRAEADELTGQSILLQDRLRTVKADEDNYLLYLRRQEEARISEALDRQRISNLVIAEPAHVPAVPTSARWLVLVSGLGLAIVASALLGYIADARCTSFRTPDELRRVLQVPVLATLPAYPSGRVQRETVSPPPPDTPGWTM